MSDVTWLWKTEHDTRGLLTMSDDLYCAALAMRDPTANYWNLHSIDKCVADSTLEGDYDDWFQALLREAQIMLRERTDI